METTITKQNQIFIDFGSNNFETGLLNLCLPLINKTVQKLNATTNTRFTGLFVNSHNVIIHNLLDNLLSLSLKTLVANYKILKQQGHFTEANEIERLKSFSDYLKEPEIREYILSQYPLLEKWLISEAQVWLNQTQLLATRLEKDFENIKNLFFKNIELGTIKRITFGLGDRHRGGKSVALIEFESGNKLIYKPRNLSIDYHFSCFLSKLDEQVNIGFLTPKTLRFESYGWVEYITYKSCATIQEIERYYFRKGAYLAVLYAMEATDFHYENIIAHGEHPVLIDLESFFYPYLPILGTETNQGIDQSVLRTGILPSTISSDKNKIDISGLSDVENKEGLLANMVLKMDGDDISFIRDKGTLIGGKNVPLLNNQKITIDKKYLPHFKRGFKKVYAYLSNNKELVKANLSIFRNDEVRVLFRNTIAYIHLLEESTHPKILENENVAKKHFQLLQERIKVYRLIEKLVGFEEQSLMKREVPLFTTRVNSRHLWYEDDKYLKNFFDDTGINTVFRKIDTLSEADLKKQLWIIDTSFAINFSTDKKTPLIVKINPNKEQIKPCREQLLAESVKVADYIIESIHCNDDTCNWLVFKAANLEAKEYRISEAFYDLFSGMPGEILFFAYLHRVTGNEKYKTISHKALHYLEKRIDEAKNSIKVLGLYAGWGSIIDLYTKLGNLYNKGLYFNKIEFYLNTINFEALIKRDKDYSLLKGTAGFIVACLNYYSYSQSNKALILAEKAANHLLNNAIHNSNFIAWKIASKIPLSGLAHGASGFSLAFSKLYKATKKAIYRDAVQMILKYENTLFIESQNNWRDCRDVVTSTYPNEKVCSTAWAHGAPGIGLARLSLLKSGIQHFNIKKDLEIALQTTLEKGFGGKQSLTFGDFGNLELLLQYSLYYNDHNIQKKLDNILQSLMKSIQHNGWNIGDKSRYTLGLMSGVTGIGYQFLRMAYPKTVPSLLSGD
jgi:type 2 lantibiotic biosynthesis protein LanM